MITEGILVQGQSLATVEDTSTVRVRDGEQIPTSGPFEETADYLVGSTSVNVRVSPKRSNSRIS
jgi:hypothetical protein